MRSALGTPQAASNRSTQIEAGTDRRDALSDTHCNWRNDWREWPWHRCQMARGWPSGHWAGQRRRPNWSPAHLTRFVAFAARLDHRCNPLARRAAVQSYSPAEPAAELACYRRNHEMVAHRHSQKPNHRGSSSRGSRSWADRERYSTRISSWAPHEPQAQSQLFANVAILTVLIGHGQAAHTHIYISYI